MQKLVRIYTISQHTVSYGYGLHAHFLYFRIFAPLQDGLKKGFAKLVQANYIRDSGSWEKRKFITRYEHS